MIVPHLLEILCCPDTHQGLRMAEPELVARLNQQIAAGHLRNRAGQAVEQNLDAGLVRSDGTFLYPIRHGIPVMLVDEAIPLGPG